MATQTQQTQQQAEQPAEDVAPDDSVDVAESTIQAPSASLDDGDEPPEQPTIDTDEPHSEHMDDVEAPEHIEEPLEPERGSDADVHEVSEASKEETFESLDAPSFEAPNFSEEATPPPASQGGYPRVVEVLDGGVRYTVDLQTGERRAVREGETGLGDDATMRVVRWSEKPVKARSQNVGNGVVVVGRGGVRYVPGAHREPGGARDTSGPRSRPERM